MSFSLHPGDTLYLPGTGPAHDPSRAHLFIIVTKPSMDGRVLAVPVCSLKSNSDRTCLLGQGDHSKITHASFVSYAEAEILNSWVLEKKISDGICTRYAPVSVKIFALVSAGVQVSMRTPLKIKNFHKAQA